MKIIRLGILSLFVMVVQADIFELVEGEEAKLILDDNLNNFHILKKNMPLTLTKFKKASLASDTASNIEVNVGNIRLNSTSRDHFNTNPPKENITFKDYITLLQNTIKSTGILSFLIKDLRTPSNSEGKSADAILLTLSKNETHFFEVKFDNPDAIVLTFQDTNKRKNTIITNGIIKLNNLDNGTYKIFIEDREDNKMLKKFEITLID